MSTTQADPTQVSELQTMIADSVDRLFAEQVTPELQKAFDHGDLTGSQKLFGLATELGLDRALVPAEADGSGATWSEAYPVFRALGHSQAPVPLAETMIAALLCARAGIALPEAGDGALTLIDANHAPGLTLAGNRINGTALGVPWARAASHAVVCSADRIALVNLRQAGVRIDPDVNLANEPRDTVHCTAAAVLAEAPRPFAQLNEPVWMFGALARAVMLVGALEAALATAVEHANTRVQFGKPLGKQQAIQQQLGELAGMIGAARMAAKIACTSAPVDATPCPAFAFDLAVAKVRAGEAATRATNVVHQVMGAIGFTQEHHLHFTTRRLWSWRSEFGSDADWAAVLGKAAITAGPGGFWNMLTTRALASTD